MNSFCNTVFVIVMQITLVVVVKDPPVRPERKIHTSDITKAEINERRGGITTMPVHSTILFINQQKRQDLERRCNNSLKSKTKEPQNTKLTKQNSM